MLPVDMSNEGHITPPKLFSQHLGSNAIINNEEARYDIPPLD